MTATSRRATTEAAPRDWRASSACRNADPDLFWPESDTPDERIQRAKRICARCPVKEFCLDEAYRTNEWDAISGGLTGSERAQLLNPAVSPRWHARRIDNADARKLAVQFGAELLIRLVKQHASVEAVAEYFSTTPRALYGAYRMLVPAPPGNIRTHAPSVIEKLLMNSKECLMTLERLGRSHTEIATVLGTSQSIVSASLAVLRQREDGLGHLSRKGPQDAVERCWAEEARVRRESGWGLTVDDVIEVAGTQILALHGSGMTLREVASRIGFNREAVRLAYRRMTEKKTTASKVLTQNQMEEAA